MSCSTHAAFDVLQKLSHSDLVLNSSFANYFKLADAVKKKEISEVLMIYTQNLRTVAAPSLPTNISSR